MLLLKMVGEFGTQAFGDIKIDICVFYDSKIDIFEISCYSSDFNYLKRSCFICDIYTVEKLHNTQITYTVSYKAPSLELCHHM